MGPPPPIEMLPIIKRVTTKPLVYSASISLAFSRTTAVTDNNINGDDQGAWAPSIQFFVNQIKCITREKF